jgi:hypothetical protein
MTTLLHKMAANDLRFEALEKEVEESRTQRATEVEARRTLETKLATEVEARRTLETKLATEVEARRALKRGLATEVKARHTLEKEQSKKTETLQDRLDAEIAHRKSCEGLVNKTMKQYSLRFAKAFASPPPTQRRTRSAKQARKVRRLCRWVVSLYPLVTLC